MLTNTQLVNEGLNQILGKHTKNGYVILTSYRGEKSLSQNKSDFEQLKSEVRSADYSYIPVYGGYIENIGTEDQRDVKEPSLFIPNYKVGTTKPYEDSEGLKELGIKIANKYNQDTFLYKPSNGDDKAYFIKKNGDIDQTFNNKTVNDLTQMYFTDLTKNFTNKKNQLDKTNKRYSFTENYYLNNSPIDLNEAKNRYGEMFFNLSNDKTK